MGNDLSPPPVKVVDKLIDRILAAAEIVDTDIEHFYPYQRDFASRILESIIVNDGDVIIGEFSRQSGKSRTLASIMSVVLPMLRPLSLDPRLENTTLGRFRGGFWSGIFAPAEHQAQNVYTKIRDNCSSPEYKELLKDFGVKIISDTQKTIKLNNLSYVKVQSASSSALVESYTFHLILIDEAQDVATTVVQKSIHPMCAATLGTIVKIGTPKEDISDCDFFESIEAAKTDKKTRRNYFRFDSDTVEKYNSRYKKFIDKEKLRLGINSIPYRMSYRLEWPASLGMFMTKEQFYGLGEWEGRGLVGNFGWQTEKRWGIQVAGIDWAKNLGDTIVTIGDIDLESQLLIDNEYYYDVNVINYLQLHGEDYEQQYPKVVNFLLNYNIERMHVDGTSGSVGDPIYSRLAADSSLSGIPMESVSFNTSNKSRLYKQGQQEMQAGRVKIAGNAFAQRSNLFKDTETEFLQLQKGYTANGFLKVNKPLNRRGAKDDIPDSTVLMVDAARKWAGTRVSTFKENVFLSKRRPDEYFGVSRVNKKLIVGR